MYGSLPASCPHVVEPDCRADSRVWTDLRRRSNPSEYLHGRYAWICGASSRLHPSRLLHLEYVSLGGLSAQGTTWIPMVPISCWEGHTNESHSGQAGSGAVGSSITGSNAAGSSDGAPLVPATPIFQGSAGNPIPAGGSATKEVYKVGSHLRLLCRQTCGHWQSGHRWLWEAENSRPR